MSFSYQNLQSTSTAVVGDTTSSVLNTEDLDSFVISAVVNEATPAAGTSAAANWVVATDIITITTHGFVTGIKGQVTSTVSAPTFNPVQADYFVRVIDANTFYLYSTLAGALAGGATALVDITATGSGNHTFTPTALTAASIKLQYPDSVDRDNWVTIPDTTEPVYADSTFVWEIDNIRYPHYRVFSTLTAGYMTVDINAVLKRGD